MTTSPVTLEHRVGQPTGTDALAPADVHAPLVRALADLVRAGTLTPAPAPAVTTPWALHARPAAGTPAGGRSAGVILTATSSLAAGATAVVIGDGTALSGVAAAGVALIVMVLTQVVAPSVLSEIALFAAGSFLMGALPASLRPEATGPAYGTYDDDWQTRNLVNGGLLLGLGALWAWLFVRWLRHRTLGVTLGLGLCLVGAMTTTGRSDTPAVVAMAVIAGATLLTYVRDPVWPWIAATVIAASALVFLIAGDTLGPAFAFLVAGLVLLGGVAVAVLLQRRRARAAAIPSEWSRR